MREKEREWFEYQRIKLRALVKALTNLKIKMILLKIHDAEVKVKCEMLLAIGHFCGEKHMLAHTYTCTHQLECVRQALCVSRLPDQSDHFPLR